MEECTRSELNEVKILEGFSAGRVLRYWDKSHYHAPTAEGNNDL